MKGQGSKSDHNVLTIKKDDSLYANDASRNFFNFFNQGHAEPDSSFTSSQSVIIVDCDMHDRDFFGGRSQKHHNANGRQGLVFAIEGKQRLGFVIAYANGKAARSLFNSWMAKLSKRIDNSIADAMLSGIKEQQILEF